ncbi:unnamed protein product, partial [Ectocarpus fasciculatus]
ELLLEASGGYTFATTISAGNRVTAVEDKRPSGEFQPVTTALKLLIDGGDNGVSLPGLFDELEKLLQNHRHTTRQAHEPLQDGDGNKN